MTSKTLWIVAALVLSAVVWFGMLGYRDLADPDEGRYAEIPAAMVNASDWVTPRLNGILYFEKPPLQYWATAAIYTVFGQSATTARLWTALAGFALIVIASSLTLALFGTRAAIIAWCLTISGFMFITSGHMLSLDMSLALFVNAALACLIMSRTRPAGSRSPGHWMTLGWVFLALGTLTKGPVAVVLVAGPVAIYMLWQRDWSLIRHCFRPLDLLLYLLITVPWFVAVDVRHPGFANFFFIHENFQRYTSTIHSREGPIYYFAALLVVGAFPWIVASLGSLIRPGFKWKPQPGVGFEPVRLLWLFVVFVVAFFTISQSKLPGYVLPVFPALAVISAGRLAKLNRVAPEYWLMVVPGLALFFGAPAVRLLDGAHFSAGQWLNYAQWIRPAGLALFAAAVALFILRRRPIAAYLVAALLTLSCFRLLELGFDSLSESRSGRAVAEAIMRSVPAGTPVYSYGTYSESSAFYLGSPVQLIDYGGELTFGQEMEPGKVLPDYEAFLKRWRAEKRAALIWNRNLADRLNLVELEAQIVYKGPKRMVIIKS